MLYLVLPNGAMRSAPVADDVLRGVAVGAGVNELDWTDHDQRSDRIIAGLALRYGTSDAAGIVLSGTYVRLAGRPDALIAANDSARAVAAATHELDQLMQDREPSPELVQHWISLGGRVQRATGI